MQLVFHLPSPRRSAALGIGDLLTAARTAEDLGIHGVCASDHPFPVTGGDSPAHHTYDPFVLLSHVSALTTRLRLLFSLLVVPYRNPFLTASMLATLDAASGGRVVAGLGAGYARPEFDALGAAFDGRGRRVGEAVTALRAAWTGEPVTLKGDGWHADGNTLRPVPSAPIPLWRGGNGPGAVEHAARELDGWMPFEANAGMAAAAGTTEATLRTLADQVTGFRDRREELRPGEPADICFVRTNPRWNADEQRGADQLRALADMGVTWVESGTAARTPDELLDDVRRLARVARLAGHLG